MSALVIPKRHGLRASWAPLYYYPIAGSQDRVTVAVIAVSDDGSQVAVSKAPGLERLYCLFGEKAEMPLGIIDRVIEALKKDFGERRIGALTEPSLLFSGFEFGEVRVGSGQGIKNISDAWIKQISLLSVARMEDQNMETDTVLAEKQSVAAEREIRLVPSVKREVLSRVPFVSGEFNYLFRSRGKAVPVRIGFHGRGLVADFSRLSTRSLSASFEKIRSKLWVLADHRDEAREMANVPHEMLVLRKPQSELTRDERFAIDGACHDLEIEADRREIRLRPLTSISDIAERIVDAEAA